MSQKVQILVLCEDGCQRALQNAPPNYHALPKIRAVFIMTEQITIKLKLLRQTLWLVFGKCHA